MNFDFSPEQDQLRSSLRSFLADHCSFDAVRAAQSSGNAIEPSIWTGLAGQLGVLGASFDESAGGLGGSAVDTMVIMEEVGEALAPVSYVESIIVAGSLLAAAGDRASELGDLISGKHVYAFAWAEPTGRYRFNQIETQAVENGGIWTLNGLKTVVTAAPAASRLIVTARTSGNGDDSEGVSLFLVDPAARGVALTAYPTIDGRRAADIRFDDVELRSEDMIGTVGAALPAIEHAGDAAIAAIGAEAVGIMRKLLQDTIDYTRQRRQFGQPIASFQALQHRMVDMFMQLELATSAVYLATLRLDGDPRERAKAASAAKVTVGNALRFIGQNAVQLHGGMGMTDELPIGHYFKRATVIESEYGSTDYHVARYAELSGQR